MNNPKHLFFYDKLPINIHSYELSSKERSLISYFSAKTVEEINNFSVNRYILLYCKLAAKLFGRGYSKHLNSLIGRGILERKIIGNDKNDKPYYYSKDDGRCTSYTLNKETIGCLERGEYSREIVKVPYVYPRKTPPIIFTSTDEPDSSCAALVQKVLDTYQGIAVSEDWQNQFNETNPDVSEGSYQNAKLWINQIQRGEITVSISENGRIHHPLILLQRVLRPFVSKDGANLVGIDGKAFHPHLLASFLPESKRQEYLDYLAAGIYELFMPDAYEDYKKERDEVKSIFQIFLAEKEPRGRAIEISSWYDANFPEITERKRKIHKAGDTVQMTLQRLESEIFINRIFANADFWCLPMHDGLVVKPEDTARAVAFCARHIQEFLGFNIKMESKRL